MLPVSCYPSMSAEGSTPPPRRIGTPVKRAPGASARFIPSPAPGTSPTEVCWATRNSLNLSEFEETVLDDPAQALDRWPTWFRQLVAADPDSLTSERQFVRTHSGTKC